MSFYYSSEISLGILNAKVAIETRDRLFREHLGIHYRPAMQNDFGIAFNAFKKIASMNLNAMRTGSSSLHGRPVWLVPSLPHQTLMRYLSYGMMNKVFSKIGVGSDVVMDRIGRATEKYPKTSKFIKSFIRSKL
jgi:hypothetical protein